MKCYVAMRFDPEACALLEICAHPNVAKVWEMCEKLSGRRFDWAACPGGADPEYPEQLTPIYFSYDKESGTEGTWEIFVAKGEV